MASAAPSATIRDQIVQLADQGIQPAEIARKVGCSRHYAGQVVNIERPKVKQHPNGQAKPTMGYAQRKEAIVALHDEGKRGCEIAQILGISRPYVSGVLSIANRTRKNKIDYLHLPPHMIDALHPMAVARGVTVKTLVLTMLTNIMNDGLVGAIMDDDA